MSARSRFFHVDLVYSVGLDHTRYQCYSGSMDGTIRIWSTTTGQCLHVLHEALSSLVAVLSLSPVSLVSGSPNPVLQIWDVDTGAHLHDLKGHRDAITCLQHDPLKILSGSRDGLKMWDARDGSFVRDLVTDVTGVWQVAYDDRFCIVAAESLEAETCIKVLDFGDEREADIRAGEVLDDESDRD